MSDLDITDLNDSGLEEYEANKRVRILRDSLGMGRAAFADITGLEKRTIENIEHERQKVYAWHIQKIGNIFPDYSTWLAYGKTLIENNQLTPLDPTGFKRVKPTALPIKTNQGKPQCQNKTTASNQTCKPLSLEK